MIRHTDIKNIYECMEATHLILKNPPQKPDKIYYLSRKAKQFLSPFRNKSDISEIRATIDMLRLLRVSKGNGRSELEKCVMESFHSIIDITSGNVLDAGIANLPPWEIPDSIPINIKNDLIITAELSEFAVECVDFIRPRDALACNRRKYALEMLGCSSSVFNMPQEIIDYAFKLMKTKKREASVTGALQFIKLFYQTKENSIPIEVEEKLLKFVLKTDSRGLAVGALNILVEAGNICEFTALEHIDEWKERNYN